jgi:predicted DCC family thiol-disulfide oxidoreductase YuxK
MDAQCALCARGARWIAHNDRRDEFRIIPIQSALGRSLLIRNGLDPDDPASWLYIENGKVYASLDALIRVGLRLGGVWRLLGLLRILPEPLQDKLYKLVATRRYAFGRTDLCTLPDVEVRRRLVQ